MQQGPLKHLYQTIKRLAEANFDKKCSFLIATSLEKQGTTTALKHGDMQHISIDEEHALNIFYNANGLILEINQEAIQQLKINLQTFFKKLNRCHRHLKISGFLFFIDISDFMIHNQENQSKILKSHANHLQQLVNALDYPVRSALFMTKLDQITGFIDYYSQSHQIELEEALGFSVPHQHNHPKFSSKFSEVWSHFIHNLNQNVIDKIHHTRANKKRILIREFPLQIALMESTFLQFLKLMKHPKTHIHGIYFTCCEQRGKNVNVLNEKIENALIMISPMTAIQSVNYRQFFIRGAIKHCQEITTYTPKKSLWFDKKNFGLFGLLSITSIWLIWASIQSHWVLIHTGSTLRNHRLWGQQFDYHQKLNVLETCFINLQRIPFIFNHSSEIKAIKGQIQETELTLFKNHLQKEYENLIQNEMLSTQVDKSFHALKVYKILHEKRKTQTSYVLDWLESHLRHPNKTMHMNLLKKFIWSVDWQADADKIHSTQAFLNALPPEYIAYQLIKEQLTQKAKNIEVAGFQPEKFLLPECYTRSGFDHAKSSLDKAYQIFKQDAWVLEKDFSENIKDQILDLYMKDYVSYWHNISKKLKPSHFNSFTEANQVLSRLETQQSFQKILSLIKKETAPRIHKQHDVFNQKIASQFTALHFSKTQAESIESFWKELIKFTNTFLVIDDHGQASFQYLRSYFNQTQYNDTLYTLDEMIKHIPEPQSTWLAQISEDLWLSLFQSTKNYINEIWQDKVYHPYMNEIATHYPFHDQQTEVSVDSFERYFSPNGIIQQFFREYLQAFTNMSQAQWEVKVIQDKQFPIRSAIIESMMQANVITNMFFPNNSAHARIQFSIEKMSLDPVISHLKLSIGEQIFQDNQQENTYINNLTWPQNNASLKIQTIEGKNFVIDESGQWALFRLLQQVNVLPDPNDPSALQILLEINGNSGRYLLKSTSFLNPFTPGILPHFKLDEKITD